MKVYLIANDKNFPKTHDLVKLTGICKEVDVSFSQLSENVAELIENFYKITKESRKFLKMKLT